MAELLPKQVHWPQGHQSWVEERVFQSVREGCISVVTSTIHFLRGRVADLGRGLIGAYRCELDDRPIVGREFVISGREQTIAGKLKRRWRTVSHILDPNLG